MKQYTRQFALKAAIGAMGLLPVLAVAQTQIYVNPRGSDTWSGTLARPNQDMTDGPKRSLDGAKAAIRTIKRLSGMPAGGFVVNIANGTYYVRSTFTLQTHDSGTASNPIVWRGESQDGVIIDGGRPIRLWRPAPATELGHLNAARKRNVLMTNLRLLRISNLNPWVRRGFPYVTSTIHPEVFLDGKRLPVAQYPNGDEWLRVSQASASVKNRLKVQPSSLTKWKDFSNAWAYGYFGYYWADSYEKISSIDKTAGTINLESDSYYGIYENQPFKLMNVLQELDSNGEYYIDYAKGLMYLYASDRSIRNRVTISANEGPMLMLENASHVKIENLTLQHGRLYGVSVFQGNDNVLSGLKIQSMGRHAVWFKGGQRNGVESCDISEIGESAIELDGGDRLTLTAGNNYAVNNNITRYARVCRTYRPGIHLAGVGNRAANNRIYDAPHQAILINGNNHIVELNQIKDVCKETTDSGAIYIGRDFTEQGNIIRYNLIEDVRSTVMGRSFSNCMGVYLDDFTSGTTVYGNVMRNCDIGVLVGGGRDNTIQNNLFDASEIGVFADARGTSWSSDFMTQPWFMSRLNAVNYTQAPFSTTYPALANLLNDDPAQPKRNRIERNITVGSTGLELLDGLVPEATFGPNTLYTVIDNYEGLEPGFNDLAGNDFGLIPGGAADRIGFVTINTADIGLQLSSHRPSINPIPPSVPAQ